MKKILSILLIIVYSTATFGMTVKQFYCCGKLQSFSFSFTADNKEKQTKDDGCCKTKYHHSKVKDNHIASGTIAFTAKYFVHPEINFPVLNTVSVTASQLQKSNTIHGPPLLLYGNTPIYISICTFRI